MMRAAEEKPFKLEPCLPCIRPKTNRQSPDVGGDIWGYRRQTSKSVQGADKNQKSKCSQMLMTSKMLKCQAPDECKIFSRNPRESRLQKWKIKINASHKKLFTQTFFPPKMVLNANGKLHFQCKSIGLHIRLAFCSVLEPSDLRLPVFALRETEVCGWVMLRMDFCILGFCEDYFWLFCCVCLLNFNSRQECLTRAGERAVWRWHFYSNLLSA